MPHAMKCHGCVYCEYVEDVPPELIYEDVIFCRFLEEYVVLDEEPCVYFRPL